VGAETGRECEEEAGSVDGGVSDHVAILPQAVVGFAEGDTWDAAGDEGSVDRQTAPKEAILPRPSISRRSRAPRLIL